jgi:hypothetical protein
VRTWSDLLDLPLRLSQTNFFWSVAAVEADVDSATYDMVTHCGADPNPRLDLVRTHTGLSLRLYGGRWSEPLDLPLLLSQTNFIWSVAAVEADVVKATHNVVAQCGAGGQPKLDLLSSHTRL